MKSCSGCGTEMNSSNAHHREIARPNGKCRPCLAAKAKRYRAENKAALNKQRRDYYRRNPDKYRKQNLKRYGLSVQGWEEMFGKQGRKCAICETTATNGRGWQTDHDHSTGVVRGILCHHCNSLLGHAMESDKVLLRAIEYLKTHSRADHKPENRAKAHGKKF